MEEGEKELETVLNEGADDQETCFQVFLAVKGEERPEHGELEAFVDVWNNGGSLTCGWLVGRLVPWFLIAHGRDSRV